MNVKISVSKNAVKAHLKHGDVRPVDRSLPAAHSDHSRRGDHDREHDDDVEHDHDKEHK